MPTACTLDLSLKVSASALPWNSVSTDDVQGLIGDDAMLTDLLAIGGDGSETGGPVAGRRRTTPGVVAAATCVGGLGGEVTAPVVAMC